MVWNASENEVMGFDKGKYETWKLTKHTLREYKELHSKNSISDNCRKLNLGIEKCYDELLCIKLLRMSR